MFCRKCGEQLNEGAKFCKNCGTPVPQQTTPAAQADNTAVQQTMPVQPDTAAQTDITAQADTTPQQTMPMQPDTAAQQTTPAQPPKKKGKAGMIFAVLGILLLLCAAGGGIFWTIQKSQEADSDLVAEESEESRRGSGKKDREKDKPTEPSVTEEPTPDPSVEPSTEPDEPKPSEPSSAEPIIEGPALAKRTVMIYMVGSNLETPSEKSPGGAGTADIAEMLAADIPENTNVILQCGGAKKWVNPQIPDGEVTRFSIENQNLTLLKKLGRASMTKTGALSDFITFAADNYPAEHYTLLLWDHGGGVPAGFGIDELDAWGDSLYDYELRQELKDANVNFDAVIFDACNMCTLEVGMAIEDFADYMVGAESWVNGVGIYYTGWLEKIDHDDARSFCEIIVQDYMKTIHEADMVGSMSVIRTDLLEEVYDAYIQYISDLNKSLDRGGYENYIQARGNCGYYASNDSVDLITLAGSYNTNYSTPLINSVVNSVVYTQSDLPYGHGLMAYSPYKSYDLYSNGRESFVRLGYDDRILNFYDNLMSQRLSYLGTEYVAAYGGDWYVDNYIVEEGYLDEEPEVYTLNLTEGSHYYYAELDEEDWDIVDVISQTFILENEGYTILLGEDYTYQKDSHGRLALVYPEAWIFLNGEIAGYHCVDHYEDPDSDAWAQTGFCPILVNGYTAYLYIYFDNDYPGGTILGYYFGDFETVDIDMDTCYTFEDDDIIDRVFECIDDDGFFYEAAGTPCKYKDLTFEYLYLTLEAGTTYGYYTIEDVYGNIYETDIVELGYPEDLE